MAERQTYKKPNYDKRFLITLNVYNHNIPFISRKASGIDTVDDYVNLIRDNKDLIKEIYSSEKSTLKASGLNDSLMKLLMNIVLNDEIKKEDSKELEESGELNFYKKKLSEFKNEIFEY